VSGGRLAFARGVKRATDIALAAAGLILVAPLLAIVATAVWLSLGPPILFRHERSGLHGRPFTFLKFRTMLEAPGAIVSAPADEEKRVSRLGRVLRRASLDELPQLWNVLRGDMSLVGPRPLPAFYLPRYSDEERRRHDVRPGMTGWAQINGRNAITWDDRLALDVWYVDHWSIGLDVRILGRTLRDVLRARLTSPDSQRIMEEFRGHS
jgi:sugar transferase EpsL